MALKSKNDSSKTQKKDEDLNRNGLNICRWGDVMKILMEEKITLEPTVNVK